MLAPLPMFVKLWNNLLCPARSRMYMHQCLVENTNGKAPSCAKHTERGAAGLALITPTKTIYDTRADLGPNPCNQLTVVGFHKS